MVCCSIAQDSGPDSLQQQYEGAQRALTSGTYPEVQYHDGKIFGNFAFLTMQKLWQAAPDSLWKHQAEGEALESQGSFEAAVGQYREVLARDPQRPEIHYRLGQILLSRSQKT